MFNVCPACGEYSDVKAVDPAGPDAICPFCGHRHRFRQLPLFVVTGASATGKSAVCLSLPQAVPECVTLECDVLWRPEFDDSQDGYRDFRNLWLRLAKNIGQSGRPVVLCGSAIPEQYESCPERRYFTVIHYLALVCEDGQLSRRLMARPDWRGTSRPDYVERMLAFNRWFRDHAETVQPPISLLDTTCLSIEQSVGYVATWVHEILREGGPSAV
jgi:hypothetical protein